ncbi:peptidylprolyl isomerase [Clostridium sp. P21]|uniref:Peptidyl-prolyl cis-trans isomerase n=2 Tax=Clostridium muellerianum TaxID=2716538 RepID=A0A7Y0EIR6_9CLOT|nr:peptidylprolyl isomerase [Clostridium muellerianum]
MFLAVVTLALSVFGCSKTPSTDSAKQKDNTNSNSTISSNYKSKYTGKKPVVTIEMEDGAVIKAELYPDIAPRTVDNFVDLIQKNFYNGLIFHRVIPGFMIQGGDPLGNGTGGSKVNIPGEFKSNGFNNDLKHTRGVLSMARSQDPNSASSQFFIMVKDASHLDGDYAAFGKVTQGMEEVDKIVNVKRDESDKPSTPQKMKKVTVEIK